jgi:hypothetical protein
MDLAVGDVEESEAVEGRSVYRLVGSHPLALSNHLRLTEGTSVFN